ncbi:MAG TPA: QsdR family transcriptional regulator [Candidatus Limnocylindrales bacterium]|nr:QsdR family transcriptional regulator [Candidatus Limnocylindrales bacterium]
MGDKRGVRRVISEREVVRGACRHFLRHATLDMEILAVELSISRATLYRVVHSRDRLLGAVLWRLGERILSEARRERSLPGVDGVLQVTRMFCGRLRMSEPFRTFLAAEPATAARVLFTASGGVHGRIVAAQHQIFLEVGAEWACADLAYLYVRVVESALYAELLTGHAVDPVIAERAARSVLVS